MNIKPEWIWVAGRNTIDQYAEFRREFYLDRLDDDAELQISVDTNFAAYINGQFVGTGQFGDFPENKTFSKINVADKLIAGKNILSILVYYCGQHNSSYIPGPAGLWFVLNSAGETISSDCQTLVRVSPAYRQNRQTKLTPQMGFVFAYNAALNDDWLLVDYVCDGWNSAVAVAGIEQPEERPLPMLKLKANPEFNIVAQGVLKRDIANDEISVAALMQRDFLSSRRRHELFSNLSPCDIGKNSPGSVVLMSEDINADGAYLVVDFGRQECGFIDLKLSADAGTVIDIAVGEHLTDLRVRAHVGGRNFASRYITTGGQQQFTHFTNRYSGRYMQLHITNIGSSLTLDYAGLIPAEYPLTVNGDFSCPDSLLNKIYAVSCRTLHICMHEHYEDTPWREQALYANDSRNQALTGYYTFGEYALPRVSFDILAKTLSDDGYQELAAPMRFDFTIPSFTMVWFLAIRDHLLFSGDLDAAQKQLPAIGRMFRHPYLKELGMTPF